MKKVKVGLVGLGVVGKSVYEILVNQQEIFASKIDAELELVAVSNRSKKDFVDESRVKFVENPLDLARDKEIDIIIEVAGNAANIQELWVEALKNGKNIVTANKALLADKGFEMAQLAEENNCHIAYEASCAGAIPVVKMFREGFSANKINAFCGILNGTSNYILTKMAVEGIDFSVALKQAQDAGYAEADPTFDIEGIDAAHKLALLAANASKTKPQFDGLYIEGLTKITSDDINFADEFGYKIKLLGIYKDLGETCIQAVYPAFVAKDSKIASVDDSFNAIFTQGSNAGDSLVVGRGAGGFQTASAVMADVIDFAAGRFSFEFGAKTKDLGDAKIVKIKDRVGKYFVRIAFDKNANKDEILPPEFLAKIKSEQSYFVEKDDTVLCGIITDELLEKDFVESLNTLSKKSKEAFFIRIESF